MPFCRDREYRWRRRLKATNPPPPISASRAAIQGQGSARRVGPSGLRLRKGSLVKPGCGAAPVVTSSGSDGVIGRVSAAMLEEEIWSAGGATWRVASRTDAAGPAAGVAAASRETASPLRGGAAAVVAGCAGVVALLSFGRVTLPCRLKFAELRRADGFGRRRRCGVTSIGASLFWANAGPATARAMAAPTPLNVQFFMRRIAVILPRPACWMSRHRPVRRPARLVAPLLATKSRRDKHFQRDQRLNVRRPAPIPRRPPPRS